MYSLFRKEIGTFFSSLVGYLVIIVFLLTNSLFLWVFPGNFNIPESNYASLDSLFIISPWVFLFLVSAVTMRIFADEKKQGTLELLFTKPISEFNIVLAKYLASVSLVILSIIPTFIFLISVYMLGNPVGNLDTGGTWGSYIGLFFLAAIYASIGVFSSSLTDNQVIAFIISAIISLLFFMGFDALASFSVFSFSEGWISYLGINGHYKSMSRGVLDSRDIVYFLGVITFFLVSTKTVLQSRKWKQ